MTNQKLGLFFVFFLMLIGQVNGVVKEGFIKATDGIKLHYYEFLPAVADAVQSVVIGYHGGGVHSGKAEYQAFGRSLAGAGGIACYMIDFRGHGKSEGKRGHTPTSYQIYQDIHTMILTLKRQYLRAKIYLAAHSLGACLSLIYLNQSEPVVDGFIMIAPFLGMYSGTFQKNDRAQRQKNLINYWPVVANFLTCHSFCRDHPAVTFSYTLEQLQEDPLLVKSYTVNMVRAGFILNTKAYFENLSLPIAMFIGQEDESFIPAKCIEYLRYVKTPIQLTCAQVIPNQGHESVLTVLGKTISDMLQKWAGENNNS